MYRIRFERMKVWQKLPRCQLPDEGRGLQGSGVKSRAPPPPPPPAAPPPPPRTIPPLEHLRDRAPIIAGAPAFGLDVEAHLPAAVVAKAHAQMPPLRHIVAAPAVGRHPEVLNQQPPHPHRRHRHDRCYALDAMRLRAPAPHDVARHGGFVVQIVAVDAVEAAGVEAALRDEGVEVVAQEDVGVGHEQPLAPRAPQRNVLRVELQGGSQISDAKKAEGAGGCNLRKGVAVQEVQCIGSGLVHPDYFQGHVEIFAGPF
jgi:hypothetical protein